MSKRRIQQFYEHFDGDVYISFSGGKDSTVLLHLARQLYPDIKAMFVDTGLEYPEIKEFVKKQKNVDIVRPEKTFKEIIDKYGYPVISKQVSNAVHYAKKNIAQGKNTLRVRQLRGEEEGSKFNKKKWGFLLDAPFDCSDHCCDYLKKRPASSYHTSTGLYPIIATLASDSLAREATFLKNGCNAFSKGVSTPMGFWTEQDVLEYIHTNFLEIAEVYGGVVKGETYHTMGVERTGCVFCMFGIAQEGTNNRFKKLQETHPQLHKYCMKDLGIGKVLDYINIDGGQND